MDTGGVENLSQRLLTYCKESEGDAEGQGCLLCKKQKGQQPQRCIWETEHFLRASGPVGPQTPKSSPKYVFYGFRQIHSLLSQALDAQG